jgi:hypothetical protein
MALRMSTMAPEPDDTQGATSGQRPVLHFNAVVPDRQVGTV